MSGVELNGKIFNFCLKTDDLQSMLSNKQTSISRKSTFFSHQKDSARRLSSIQSRRARSDLSDYDILETLGVGGFGTVKKAIHKPTGQLVAVKVCDSRQGAMSFDSIERQAQLQRSILHANIAQIYEIVHYDDKTFIFMEYCRNGELFDRINREGRLQQKEAARIFHQILSALIYLRRCGLSHRDIKPQNILFDENWNAKLIDFGFSCDGGGEFRNTICGTPSYSPPEIIRKQIYDPQLVDVWSLGVTLYTMMAAELPFQGATFEQRKKNILSLRYKQQHNFSAKIQKLFSSIFVDAKYRPKLQDLMDSQFMLSYNMTSSCDYIDFKNQNPELQYRVIDHIERSLKIQSKIIEDSVRSCRLDRYRAIYYLTLKNMQQLTPYKKKKSSLMKLEPISQSPFLPKPKQVFDYSQLLNLKTGAIKKAQLSKIKAPTIFNQAKIRNRDLPDSPRRLLDCLAAYKPL